MPAEDNQVDTVVEGFEIVHDEIEVTNEILSKFSGVFSAVNASLASQTKLLTEMVRLNTETFEYQQRRDLLNAVDDSARNPVVPETVKAGPGDPSRSSGGGGMFGTEFGANWLANMMSGVGLGAMLGKGGKLALRGGIGLLLHKWAGDTASSFMETLLKNNTELSEEDIKKHAETTGDVVERSVIGGAVLGKYGVVVGALSVGVEKMANWALDQAGITDEKINELIPDDWEKAGLDAEMAKTIGAVGLSAVLYSAAKNLIPALGKQVIGPFLKRMLTTMLSKRFIIPAAIIGAGVVGTKALEGIITSNAEGNEADLWDQADALAPETSPEALANKPSKLAMMPHRLLRGIPGTSADNMSEWLNEMELHVGQQRSMQEVPGGGLDAFGRPMKGMRYTGDADAASARLKAIMAEKMGIDPNNPDITGQSAHDVEKLISLFEMIGDKEMADKLKGLHNTSSETQSLQNELRGLQEMIDFMPRDNNGNIYEVDRPFVDSTNQRINEIQSRLGELGVSALPGITPSSAAPQVEPVVRAASALATVATDAAAVRAAGTQNIVAPVNIGGSTNVHGGTRSSTVNNTYIVQGNDNPLGIGH